MTLESFRAGFERLLEAIVVVLVTALTVLVIAGFCFRYAGYSLAWYDETASVGLVWLTYYGSALAALRGAHIGVPGFVNAMPRAAAGCGHNIAEACVFVFFAMLAWTGFQVLVVLAGDGMVSLPWVPLQITDSVIPIGAVLFLIAEALRLPAVMRDARARASSTPRRSRPCRTARPTPTHHAGRTDDHHPDARRHDRACAHQCADRDCARLRRHAGDHLRPGPDHAAEPGAGDVRRRLELPAAGDPAVHPGRRDHERVVDLAPADRLRHRAASASCAAACRWWRSAPRCSSPRFPALRWPTSPRSAPSLSRR